MKEKVSEEFKKEAVRLVLTSGKTQRQIAREPGENVHIKTSYENPSPSSTTSLFVWCSEFIMIKWCWMVLVFVRRQVVLIILNL